MPVTADTFLNSPGTPANPQYAEMVVKGHSVESDGGSKPILNIFHFARRSGPGTGTETELYTVIGGLVDATISLALSVAYVPDETTMRFMDDPTRAAVSNTNLWVGAVTGDRLPNFNAVVIRKNTFARGRSYRGSTHYAPIAESQTTLDNLNAGAITLWGNVVLAWNALLAPAGFVTPDGSTWGMIVLSPTLSNLTSNPIAASGSFVKDFTLNNRIGTMKRRKDRTGPSS